MQLVGQVVFLTLSSKLVFIDTSTIYERWCSVKFYTEATTDQQDKKIIKTTYYNLLILMFKLIYLLPKAAKVAIMAGKSANLCYLKIRRGYFIMSIKMTPIASLLINRGSHELHRNRQIQMPILR